MTDIGHKTICVNCKHCNKTNSAGVWHSYQCGAASVQRAREQDPVTGEWLFAAVNDLGDRHLAETAMPYCRDINKGDCHHYEEK